MKTFTILATTASLACAAASAQDVRISTFKDEVTFSLNGETFSISRTQDTGARLTGDFARIARPCPTDCIQPMVAAPGVATIGELELLTFLERDVTEGGGLLLDSRSPAEFAASAIPGAVNVPVATLSPDNRFRNDILRALGAIDAADGTLDFDGAMKLAFYSGGNWSSDAPDAIDHLLAAGYPPEKLFYYRGGLQAWVHLGLTVRSSPNPG